MKVILAFFSVLLCGTVAGFFLMASTERGWWGIKIPKSPPATNAVQSMTNVITVTNFAVAPIGHGRMEIVEQRVKLDGATNVYWLMVAETRGSKYLVGFENRDDGSTVRQLLYTGKFVLTVNTNPAAQELEIK